MSKKHRAVEMLKVTRIAYSKDLTKSKYNRLVKMAKKLGTVRDVVWQQYGGLNALELDNREIRDVWVIAKRDFGVPKRLRNETLRDTCENINTYHEAAKKLVVNKIYSRTKDKAERTQFCKLLDSPELIKNKYVHKLHRKHFKHGKNHTYNQIVLDTDCYITFEYKNRTWLEVMSDIPRKRMAIPLNCKTNINGTLRLILKAGIVEVHYTVNAKAACSVEPCGKATLGVDKGYTETFTDSEGVKHGTGLGSLLSKESDYLKVKYQRRNKLKAVADKKPHKAKNIKQNNLGRKKLNKRKAVHTQRVTDKVCKSIHSILDRANTVVAEDLTFTVKSTKSSSPKKYFGKNMNRKLSGWVKGLIADKLKDISKRRGATLHIVNAAYTSQICHKCKAFGERKGDVFYCTECKVEYDADYNAAVNILDRLYDDEISRYDSFMKVKKLLQYRSSQRSKLIDQDSSYPPSRALLTESELVHDFEAYG